MNTLTQSFAHNQAFLPGQFTINGVQIIQTGPGEDDYSVIVGRVAGKFNLKEIEQIMVKLHYGLLTATFSEGDEVGKGLIVLSEVKR